MHNGTAAATPVRHLAVLGGGILGMFLALRLSERGHRVTVLEAAQRPGGLAVDDAIGPYRWDRFYHVILMSDRNTRALIEELGMSDLLRWGVTRTGFYTDGTLYSLSDSLEFLRFPPLSLFDKFRLGGTIFLASRIRDWRSLESQGCSEWLEKWSGKHVFERIWLPLLKSKLGDNYRIASAAFIWAIIARMYAARRSGLKREMFGYLEGGYGLLLTRLESRLRERGVEMRNGTAAASVLDRGLQGVEVTTANGDTLRFDGIIATLPTPAIASLCPQLTESESARLNGVTYQGIVCASMLTRKPLSNYYVTNITDRWVPFTGVIEMTSLVDKSAFGGSSLIYLPCYLTKDDPYWQRDDAGVRQDFIAALTRMYPHFDPADVQSFQVARARQVLAISTLDYSTRLMPGLTTSLANVFILNSAQIAAGTLNVNETLGVVQERFDALLARLEHPREVEAV